MPQDDNDVVPPLPDDEDDAPISPPDNPVPEDDNQSGDNVAIDGTVL